MHHCVNIAWAYPNCSSMPNTVASNVQHTAESTAELLILKSVGQGLWLSVKIGWILRKSVTLFPCIQFADICWVKKNLHRYHQADGATTYYCAQSDVREMDQSWSTQVCNPLSLQAVIAGWYEDLVPACLVISCRQFTWLLTT